MANDKAVINATYFYLFINDLKKAKLILENVNIK